MSTGYSHQGCYAKSLNDCSTKLSREHFVSKSILKILGEFHVLSNASWLAPGQSTDPLHVESLGARNLCKRHNEMLSHIDAANVKFFRTLINAFSVLESDIVLPQQEGSVSGDKLELWLLKSISGFLASGAYNPGGNAKKYDIPDEWLGILFNDKPWNPGAGMSIRISKATPHRGFGMGHVSVPETSDLAGGVIEFCGVEFFMFPVEGVNQVRENSEDELTRLVYRPGEIVISNETHRTRIAISWKDWVPVSAIHYTSG